MICFHPHKLAGVAFSKTNSISGDVLLENAHVRVLDHIALYIQHVASYLIGCSRSCLSTRASRSTFLDLLQAEWASPGTTAFGDPARLEGLKITSRSS